MSTTTNYGNVAAKVNAAIEWSAASGVSAGAYSRPSLARLYRSGPGVYPPYQTDAKRALGKIVDERVEAMWAAALFRATAPACLCPDDVVRILDLVDEVECYRNGGYPTPTATAARRAVADRSTCADVEERTEHTSPQPHIGSTAFTRRLPLYSCSDLFRAAMDLDVTEDQWYVAARVHRVRCRIVSVAEGRGLSTDGHEDSLMFDLLGACVGPGWLLDQAHVTDTARLVARAIYNGHDFASMPILADALEDGGCDSKILLNEMRDPATAWCRGARVLDEILGYRVPLVRAV